MFKYTLTFVSEAVNESELRSAIEALGILDASIGRVPLSVAERGLRRLSSKQQAMLAILSDNRPHRTNELWEAVGGTGPACTTALRALVAAGLAKKFKHGIYGSPYTSEADAEALPPREHKGTLATTHAAVVKMIAEGPVTPVQIRERFKVSRQRIEQILSKAERRGEVRRVRTSGERGQFVYMAADAPISEVMERSPALKETRKSVLSAMRAGDIYYATDLATELGVVLPQVKIRLSDLAKWGLVYKFSVGAKVFCGITPAGVASPDCDPSAPKMPAVDFVKEIGTIKCTFLRTLRVLGGAARTIDLTYAIGEQIFDGASYSSGQVMQRLEISGLIQRRGERRAKAQSAYELTRTGEYVAAVIDKYLPVPNAAEVKAKIVSRHERRAVRLRQSLQEELRTSRRRFDLFSK